MSVLFHAVELPGRRIAEHRETGKRIVEIVTTAAQKELLGPGVLSIASPILVAFAFSAPALGGFLAGAILTISSARNQPCGRMIRHLPAGSTYRVTIDCGVLIVATVTRQSCEQLGLEDGAEVVAAFKATAPHAIR
ncbi:MAG: sodium/proton-translocating pyrophosphatase [Candidatus Methylomirabilis oxyfera]|nr:sodium/proton-translocating pyrophosphatase [Candidatus Methylomirabilis oxyfera]